MKKEVLKKDRNFFQVMKNDLKKVKSLSVRTVVRCSDCNINFVRRNNSYKVVLTDKNNTLNTLRVLFV